MDHNIQPTLVRQLAAQFMNGSLSEEVSMTLVWEPLLWDISEVWDIFLVEPVCPRK